MPNLSLLGILYDTLWTYYTDLLRKPLDIIEDHKTFSLVDWHASWFAYTQGRICSRRAAALIHNLMLCIMPVDGLADEGDADERTSQASESDEDIPKLKLDADQLGSLLSAETEVSHTRRAAGGIVGRLQETILGTQDNCSKFKATELWRTDEIVSIDTRAEPGNMPLHDYKRILQAKARKSVQDKKSMARFNTNRHAAANWFGCRDGKGVHAVLLEIMQTQSSPNKKQYQFLHKFCSRLPEEYADAMTRDNKKHEAEPLLELVRGCPGTGESALIKWMQEIMERAFTLQNGVQFICLAFSSIMVTQIHGNTIYRWSGMPVMQSDGNGIGDRFE